MQNALISLLFTILLLAISLSAWSRGTIYKCENSNGATVYSKSPCHDDTQTVSKWEEPERERKTMSIRQKESGRYLLEGDVNGKTIIFVVDTGASGVALPESVAKAVNMNCSSKNPIAITANGLASGCKLTIPVLKFGPFKIKEVATIVLPNLDQALLGMNVLEQFNIEQNHGELRITEH